MTTNHPEWNLMKNRFRSFLFLLKGKNAMPLFTTDRVDQLFERFMKHHVSPAGSLGAKRCPLDTSAQTTKLTAPKLTASNPSWTQKKERKEDAP